jgi:hypothetical protein
MWRWMTRLLANDELRGYDRNHSYPNLRITPHVCLEALNKTTNPSVTKAGLPNSDLNSGRPRYAVLPHDLQWRNRSRSPLKEVRVPHRPQVWQWDFPAPVPFLTLLLMMLVAMVVNSGYVTSCGESDACRLSTRSNPHQNPVMWWCSR